MFPSHEESRPSTNKARTLEGFLEKNWHRASCSVDVGAFNAQATRVHSQVNETTHRRQQRIQLTIRQTEKIRNSRVNAASGDKHLSNSAFQQCIHIALLVSKKKRAEQIVRSSFVQALIRTSRGKNHPQKNTFPLCTKRKKTEK